MRLCWPEFFSKWSCTVHVILCRHVLDKSSLPLFSSGDPDVTVYLCVVGVDLCYWIIFGRRVIGLWFLVIDHSFVLCSDLSRCMFAALVPHVVGTTWTTASTTAGLLTDPTNTTWSIVEVRNWLADNFSRFMFYWELRLFLISGLALSGDFMFRYITEMFHYQSNETKQAGKVKSSL